MRQFPTMVQILSKIHFFTYVRVVTHCDERSGQLGVVFTRSDWLASKYIELTPANQNNTLRTLARSFHAF